MIARLRDGYVFGIWGRSLRLSSADLRRSRNKNVPKPLLISKARAAAARHRFHDAGHMLRVPRIAAINPNDVTVHASALVTDECRLARGNLRMVYGLENFSISGEALNKSLLPSFPRNVLECLSGARRGMRIKLLNEHWIPACGNYNL